MRVKYVTKRKWALLIARWQNWDTRCQKDYIEPERVRQRAAKNHSRHRADVLLASRLRRPQRRRALYPSPLASLYPTPRTIPDREVSLRPFPTCPSLFISLSLLLFFYVRRKKISSVLLYSRSAPSLRSFLLYIYQHLVCAAFVAPQFENRILFYVCQRSRQ